MNSGQDKEPLVEVSLGESRITLLGTAHVSRSSAEKVERLLATGEFDAVAVELCPGRHKALLNPDNLARMDLFKVLREGKVPMVAANLVLGAYQQRIAEQFGIEPGAEMRTAIALANAGGYPVLLIDRDIGITLRRIYRNVPWWRRLYLVSGLLASMLNREKVSEEQIERLKEGDMLETLFAEFSRRAHDLFMPLIDERDRYMAARLREEVARSGHARLLTVVGAGHLQGIANYLQRDRTPPADVVAELVRVPVPSRLWRLIPWMIVALVLIGFAIGFSRSPDLGWELVWEWVVINGSLAALGAILAAAHPLTVASAFAAAPLTSLNPMVGAGMVTAIVEVLMHKPNVGDFSRLRQDTSHLVGWRRNRVARVFLVFLLSTLGSAIGTYVAGLRIAGRLLG
jgi:pheromone shutdown-related protein TraB